MNNANMLRNIKWYFYSKCQQSGAEEACWAHNPEVGGSKPLYVNIFMDQCAFFHMISNSNLQTRTKHTLNSNKNEYLYVYILWFCYYIYFDPDLIYTNRFGYSDISLIHRR